MKIISSVIGAIGVNMVNKHSLLITSCAMKCHCYDSVQWDCFPSATTREPYIHIATLLRVGLKNLTRVFPRNLPFITDYIVTP